MGSEGVRPPQLNTVAEVPDAVDHTPAAGSFGSIQAGGPPFSSAHAVAVCIHAVVGTTHRSLAMSLGRREPAVARNSTLEDWVGAGGLVARDPPQIGPRHCRSQTGNIQRILWLACGRSPVDG